MHRKCYKEKHADRLRYTDTAARDQNRVLKYGVSERTSAFHVQYNPLSSMQQYTEYLKTLHEV